MSRIGVMHITDTLEVGGAERVAVNVVNLLPREKYRPYLCTTRRDGPLESLVVADVERLRLERKSRFDWKALRRLVAFIRERHIQILHAHGPSMFVTGIASLFPPHPTVIWHDHFGAPLETRSAWLNWPSARCISGVIAVSQPLAEWSRRRLAMPANRVWYIPNFVNEAEPAGENPILPGEAGGRIVCVANLRPQKDHLTLLRAMALVIKQNPSAHLLLVGAAPDPAYLELIGKEIAQHGLTRNVSLLGQRQDVQAILARCDIGVLSSVGEGLPLVLVEYGMAGLPTVCTRVGQCADVLDGGRAGILVPSGVPERLADALLVLLKSPEQRATLGIQFRRRVQDVYRAGPIMKQVCDVYDLLLTPKKISSRTRALGILLLLAAHGPLAFERFRTIAALASGLVW